MRKSLIIWKQRLWTSWNLNALWAEAQKNNGMLTASNILDGRKIASNLAKYDGNTTTAGMNVIRAIRSEIDTIAKESITGLKQIDKNYADKLDSLDRLEDGLIYKQWDKKGEFKDNFDNYIKNINNDAKSAMRKRLMEIMPDIATRIEAINKIPEIYKAYTRPSKLQGATTQLTGGFAGFHALWPVGVLLGYAGGTLAGKALHKLQQRSIERIVSKMSDAGKTRLQEIHTKLEQNRLLTQQEKTFLDTLKKEVQEVMGKVPLKPSKKLLDGKTPLKPSKSLSDEVRPTNQNSKKTSAGGKDPSPTDVYNSSIADFYKKSNKKELSREFDLNRESSYRNTIADFYKKANKSTKISEDGTPYYIRVDDVKIEYKKPEWVKNRNFKRDAFQTNETFLLTPQEKLYEKTLDDVQLAKKEKGVIGNDPEVGDILITTDKYADKYMAHWPINNANVVATINRWEYKIKNRAGDPDVVNYIKPFPKNSSYGMLVGVRKDKDGNFVTTTYEPHTKIADLLKKEEGKGGIIKEKWKETIGE